MTRTLSAFICTLLSLASFSSLADNHWNVQQRLPMGAQIQTNHNQQYQPLKHAQKPWKICALIPHLKDTYWIGIDYGLVQHSKQLGINLDLFEAGSYYNENKQLDQLDYCMKQPYDAIILGAVSPEILNHYQAKTHKPIIGLVNRIESKQVVNQVGVNWYQMGYFAGQYVSQHAQNPSTLALLTGPKSVGGSDWVEQGMRAALEHSEVKITDIRHQDNNRALYREQLTLLLDKQHPNYIVGSAVAIEAAVSALKIFVILK
ncbi:TMAO reductase system periplasmic protein TorT [Shewanella marina]|uniref:TMAO reductase system periplasmic protein TorT n=1 Tax=Shewanella marina TaxID=487319 RepID=UPI00131F24C9|nr:TMAO reductase system periplasmic protein TorT [Shewanella marina]